MAIEKYLHSVKQVGSAQGQIYFSMENIAFTIKAIPVIISINLMQIAIWSMEPFRKVYDSSSGERLRLT